MPTNETTEQLALRIRTRKQASKMQRALARKLDAVTSTQQFAALLRSRDMRATSTEKVWDPWNDTTQHMIKLRERRQHQKGTNYFGRHFEEIAGVHRTAVNPKHVDIKRRPRSYPYATEVLNYTEKSAHLFTIFSATELYDWAINGNGRISQIAAQSILLEAMREEEE